MDVCNVVATEHGRYGLSCMQKLWSAWAVLGLYGMLVSVMLSNFIAAVHGRYGLSFMCKAVE